MKMLWLQSGKGKIKNSELLDFKSVVHVPKFAYNLLSVNKIAMDSNCHVIFDDSHCEFQD